MRILIAISFVCAQLLAFGQQHSLYSQYLFNLYMVNPAYAGQHDALNVAFSTRHQWIGMEGAPRTQNFTMHSPLSFRNMSAGIHVQHDVIGARQVSSAAATYAYQVKLNTRSSLSFGLQGGLINYYIDPNKLSYGNPGDPAVYNLPGSRLIPNFDFGAFYSNRNTYLGFSALHLNSARLQGTEHHENRLQPSFNIIAGHILELSESIALKPSTIVRKGALDPLQFDANMGIRINNALWLTTTYRHRFGMVFSTHCVVRDKLHIGYAFDWAMNGLVAAQSGTHEIFLGIDLNVRRNEIIQPRFF